MSKWLDDWRERLHRVRYGVPQKPVVFSAEAWTMYPNRPGKCRGVYCNGDALPGDEWCADHRAFYEGLIDEALGRYDGEE